MKALFNHLNPSVIKSIIPKMNEEELLECLLFIRNQARDLPIGLKREMYINLYRWISSKYPDVIQRNKPSLF